MADLSTKKNPLHLRDERPDYVQDRSGKGNDDGEDVSEEAPSAINAGPQDPGSLGIEKPSVHLDEAKVRRAEAEGKGFAPQQAPGPPPNED